MGGAGGASGAGGPGGATVAGGLLAIEVCAPLLLLCWLCCWPDDASGSRTGFETSYIEELAVAHDLTRYSAPIGRTLM